MRKDHDAQALASLGSVTRRGLMRKGAALTTGMIGASLFGETVLPLKAFAAGTVNIEIDAGQNENPFRWNADAMKSKFGADIKMIGLPFVGQYEKLVSELTARSAAYDLLVFPPYFLGDFVALGFLKELDPYFKLLDPQIGDDYIPVYRDPVIKRDGKTYALMYDGDMLQVAYRKDLFDDPTSRRTSRRSTAGTLLREDLGPVHADLRVLHSAAEPLRHGVLRPTRLLLRLVRQHLRRVGRALVLRRHEAWHQL